VTSMSELHAIPLALLLNDTDSSSDPVANDTSLARFASSDREHPSVGTLDDSARNRKQKAPAGLQGAPGSQSLGGVNPKGVFATLKLPVAVRGSSRSTKQLGASSRLSIQGATQDSPVSIDAFVALLTHTPLGQFGDFAGRYTCRYESSKLDERVVSAEFHADPSCAPVPHYALTRATVLSILSSVSTCRVRDGRHSVIADYEAPQYVSSLQGVPDRIRE
jgi:hypothetical protein